jgi:hypothetical protein
MTIQFDDYLCWDEYSDKAEAVNINTTSPEEAANDYMTNHLIPRESASDLDGRKVYVVGQSSHVFEVSVQAEPAFYINRAG